MRPIKFRAWDVAGGYMITSNVAVSNTVKNHILGRSGSCLNGEGGDYPNGNLKPEDRVLMQYTGLLDKNGKEIYEGDIIENTHGQAMSVVIQERWLACVLSDKDGKLYGFDPMRSTDRQPIEVIGNIHENPELLQ